MSERAWDIFGVVVNLTFYALAAYWLALILPGWLR
jgi:hypothetical protein